MKNVTITLMLLLIASFVFGQKLDYETQFIRDYKKERASQNQQKMGDISGFCDAVSSATDQQAGIGWDDCMSTYEGVIEFEAVDGSNYNVYSTNATGMKLNDLSFGTYYECYNIQSQDGMPNESAVSPTLFFNVNEDGELSFNGSSQWGEIFSISNLVIDDAQLSFKWTNDYGEGADVQLERQDGQLWGDLLFPTCPICSDSDSLALVALYNATDGPNWNIPWDLNRPVREWYGITLNDACCVSEIDMGFSLELIELGFDNNNLVGTIPAEISDLSELTILDLASNQLEGLILPNIINLTNLRRLIIPQNSFEGTVLPEIGNLTNLEVISLSGNAFEGELPATLGNLQALEIFFSSNNNLEGELPAELGQISVLRSISLWGNQFTGSIPAEFGNLNELSNLALEFNNLSGELPASLGPLMELRNLGLSHNQFEGSIPEGFSFLNRARLDNNNLSGEIPESFSSMTQVIEMNVSNNNFTGEIPSRLFLETDFQGLYFYNNDFSACVDDIVNLCLKSYNPEFDTIIVGNQMYIGRYRVGYNFENNPKLAWEGAIQNACDGQDQIGAPCNDGNPDTTLDGIDENCDCVPGVLSTQQIEAIDELTIAPNPLSYGDAINIMIDAKDGFSAKIYLLDIQGKVVLETIQEVRNGTNGIAIDSRGINRGLYLLKIASEDKVVSRKVIIQ